MDLTKTKNKLKEKLPRIHKPAEYEKLLEVMWKLEAKDVKHAVRTKVLEEKVPGAGTYLKSLKKVKLVEVSKKGSGYFMVNNAAKEDRKRFLRHHDQIKEARENNSIALVNHIQDEHELLIISLHVLGLDENASLLNIHQKVEYQEDQDKDRINLNNYNQIVKKFKEEKITLKGYDELEWKRGSHSWYLSQSFMAECI